MSIQELAMNGKLLKKAYEFELKAKEYTFKACGHINDSEIDEANKCVKIAARFKEMFTKMHKAAYNDVVEQYIK